MGFEALAARIARMALTGIRSVDLTRPSRDGGRDAVGKYRIGPTTGGILVDFSLEAKCYSPTNSVGVKDMARLISRLRHRQFGILVTTSYVGRQAYREIKEDDHPVIVLSAIDIVEVLIHAGLSTPGEVRGWLSEEFPQQVAES